VIVQATVRPKMPGYAGPGVAHDQIPPKAVFAWLTMLLFG